MFRIKNDKENHFKAAPIEAPIVAQAAPAAPAALVAPIEAPIKAAPIILHVQEKKKISNNTQILKPQLSQFSFE
jgi:hypothetical protein